MLILELQFIVIVILAIFACLVQAHGSCALLTFLQVFDGHGGTDAASFTRKNILRFITADSHFPSAIKKAVKSAFKKADHALADASGLDRSSGTTALIALIMGR